MAFLLYLSICVSVIFASSPEEQNHKLKQTNRALTQALEQLTSNDEVSVESEVGQTQDSDDEEGEIDDETLEGLREIVFCGIPDLEDPQPGSEEEPLWPNKKPVDWKKLKDDECYQNGKYCVLGSKAEGKMAADILGLVSSVPGHEFDTSGVASAVMGGIGLIGSLITTIQENSAMCEDCCNKRAFWYSKGYFACGKMPKDWKDGRRCALGTTCRACINKAHYWFTRGMTACGSEANTLDDGERCAKGTTCRACKNDASYWFSKLTTACGREPCWRDGTKCAKGSSCKRCCNGDDWWGEKHSFACGDSPCWKSGTPCALGTTCKNCCNGGTWRSRCK